MSPQTELTDELRDHLYLTLLDVPPDERRRSRWVMNLEWLNETRRLEMQDRAGLYWTGLGWPRAQVETILGLPVEVRDDGGVPHLEPS